MRSVIDFRSICSKTWSAFFVSGFCCVLSLSISAQSPPSIAAEQPFTNENYKIGPGDVIDVIVSKNELSRSGLRVSNQGTVQLAMLDADVPAACLTERQLADTIKEQYKKYLVNPYVSVAVKDFNSTPAAVIGAVNAPGRFKLQRTIRLAELLTFVNGPSGTAGRTIEIIRDSGRPYCDNSRLVVPTTTGEELLSVPLDGVFKGGEQSNPVVYAGDIVRVVQADQMNAYIQGNVKTAMAINLKDPVSLSQAIAMAGGLSSGAQSEKIKIRRQIEGSINRNEMIVNYKEILKEKKDDILLRPNDIIDVPGPSGGKKIFEGFYRGLLPSLTRLPISVIP